MEYQIQSTAGRPFLFDVAHDGVGTGKPVILFLHGFKGFKDWGHWHLVSKAFADAGYYFVKMNFSHNGTTPEQPLEFVDTEAFGNNNYSKEAADVASLLEWLEAGQDPRANLSDITLVGHSRGGGLALALAAEQPQVRRLVTLAAVGRLGFASRYPEALENWEEEGVYYVTNGRTGQRMPLYYQLHQDILENAARFDLETAARALGKPWLILHGDADSVVDVSAARRFQSLNPNAEICILTDANHVFGGSHPYESEELPPYTQQAVDLTLRFLHDTRLLP